MNPYQRIDKIQQPGHLDTVLKFEQLVDGIDLKGKAVLDIGCNLGMMCRLAADAGASKVLGVDERRDYIEDARELWPELTFACTPAHGITGTWDVIIMSAMFHYLRDPETVLNQVARCLDPEGVVALDVWMKDGPAIAVRYYDYNRGLWVPNKEGFLSMAYKPFGFILGMGATLSPDDSQRMIYYLSDPKPTPANAVLIYGPGGSGKTTLAKTYHGYAHLQTDSVFIGWNRSHPFETMSVRHHVDKAYGAGGQEYLDFTLDYVSRWLDRKTHHDIVIEGYDLTYPKAREAIVNLVKSYGWDEVEEIKL